MTQHGPMSFLCDDVVPRAMSCGWDLVEAWLAIDGVGTGPSNPAENPKVKNSTTWHCCGVTAG